MQYKQLKEQCVEFQRHLAEKEKEAQDSGSKGKRIRRLLRIGNKAEPQSLITQEENTTQVASTDQSVNQAVSFEPDIDGVREAVAYAKQQWEEKPRLFNGRAQRCFEKCCSTMNDHIGLLGMLPQQDQYFSVLCGGIKVIINVSEIYCTRMN